MTDHNVPPPATPRPEEKPTRVFTVRDEIRDKLSVYASADKHPHRLQREIIQKQCEDFLVEMFEGAPSAPEEPKKEAGRVRFPQQKIKRFTPDKNESAFLCIVGGKGGLWTHHEAIGGSYGGKGWCRAGDVEKLEAEIERLSSVRPDACMNDE